MDTRERSWAQGKEVCGNDTKHVSHTVENTAEWKSGNKCGDCPPKNPRIFLTINTSNIQVFSTREGI